ITRNVYMQMQDGVLAQNGEYLQHFEQIRQGKKHEVPVRLEAYLNANNTLLELLRAKLMLKTNQVYYTKTPPDLSFVLDLECKLKKSKKQGLFYPTFLPQETTMVTKQVSVLEQVQHKDILISYPFESVDTLFRLFEEVIVDSATISIKLSLYRLATDSKIIKYLIEAASNGKEVTVIVELRAKMDEQNNIQWAKKLIHAGIKVIYGLPNYKVHSKMLLITRMIHNQPHYITNIGTGNYNEITAQQYTDLSLITTNQSVGCDVNEFFTAIINGEIIENTNMIITAPVTFKPFMIAMIEEEIQHAKNNKAAQILIKVNAITDREIINKLIEASQYGVVIRLVVRGICCLRPGVRGYTHNITLTSIVGRYLEHSRIYCFGVGERQKVFISSSDLMVRNTQRRIEVAIPIYDPAVKARLLQIFHVIYMDNVKANIMLANGKYRKRPVYGEKIDSQLYLYALSCYWKNGGEFSEIYDSILNQNTANTVSPSWKKILCKLKNMIGL
ncbi:MAG: polyphosphate kinase 1, partial [Oscillospiraceae bacterium]